MEALMYLEKGLWFALTVCYLYQVYYILYVMFKPKDDEYVPDGKFNKYGVVISARNEEAVIGNLIDSINAQNYPSDKINVYVIADNCTDSTADVARSKGAIVYERFNKEEIGKGYALDYFFGKLGDELDDRDAFIVFDADNVVDPEYIREMNKTFNSGYNILTSYRNSKNYGSNWISAGYSLWFLREARFLNNARMSLGLTCAVSGTGFLVSSSVIRKNGGWKFHLLTEDIQFSIHSALAGERIGYCDKAVLYDEQPTTFAQSWTQRLRWAKGFYQVAGKYSVELFVEMIKRKSFAVFDMFMTVFPAIFVGMLTAFCTCWKILDAVDKGLPMLLSKTISQTAAQIFMFYLFLYAIGLLTTLFEWKSINCSTEKKILYTFTFPIFLLSYIPISIVALFKKVTWTPIKHTVVNSIEQIQNTK